MAKGLSARHLTAPPGAIRHKSHPGNCVTRHTPASPRQHLHLSATWSYRSYQSLNESWNPKLQLVREILMTREPEVEQFPAGLRWANRLAAHSTSLSRRGNVVLQDRF